MGILSLDQRIRAISIISFVIPADRYCRTSYDCAAVELDAVERRARIGYHYSSRIAGLTEQLPAERSSKTASADDGSRIVYGDLE